MKNHLKSGLRNTPRFLNKPTSQVGIRSELGEISIRSIRRFSLENIGEYCDDLTDY